MLSASELIPYSKSVWKRYFISLMKKKHNPRRHFFDEWDYIKCLDCSWDCFVLNYSKKPQEIPSDVHCFFSFEKKAKFIATPSLEIETGSYLRNIVEKNQQKWWYVRYKNMLYNKLYYKLHLETLIVIIVILHVIPLYCCYSIES